MQELGWCVCDVMKGMLQDQNVSKFAAMDARSCRIPGTECDEVGNDGCASSEMLLEPNGIELAAMGALRIGCSRDGTSQSAGQRKKTKCPEDFGSPT